MIRITKLIRNKVVSNASWIVAGKAFQSVLSLLVTMISARYLGPENYGLISYASSVTAFLAPVALLGLNNILVQELIAHPKEEGKILGSSIYLSLLSSVICMLGVASFSAITNAGEITTILVCTLYSIVLLCQSCELIIYWFQANYLSKYSSLISLCAYVLVSVYKIILLISGSSIYLFSISNALDFFLIFILSHFIYKKRCGQRIYFDRYTAKCLLEKSKHYIIPDLMVAVYLQTDRIMIKMMLGTTATGYYSAAVSCATFVSFVYIAIINSARPMIYENRKKSVQDYEKSISLLYSVIFYLSVLVAGVICIFAKPVVSILYGESYYQAIPTLLIVAWMPTFSYLGTVRNIWILGENKQNHLWFVTMLGALGNMLLNALLIPRLDICGAALASVLTQFFTNVVMTIAFKPYRRCGVLLLRSINLLRILRNL